LSHTTNLLEYLMFSILAGLLLTTLIVLTPTARHVTPPETIMVAASFMASSILGISLTMRPHWLQNHRDKIEKIKDPQPSHARAFRGHHPDCQAFYSHILQRNDSAWCAGCLGITIGLLIGIGLAATEALAPLPLTPSLPWLSVGFLLITAAFAEMALPHRHALVHTIANSLLGPGLALIVFVTFQHTGQAVFGLFALLLGFLWMDTRVQISRWRHEKLCAACDQGCKSYPKPSLMTSDDPDAQ
jgi:hypothetical protein